MLNSQFLMQYQTQLTIRTSGKCLHKVTTAVQSAIAQSRIQTGMCHLFLRHTSASLTIQENADPDVLQDLTHFFAQLVPETAHYVHSAEGPDDMPAHIRTVLTHTSEQIPIAQGRLVLGTWQGIYVWEHRNRGSDRELFIHITGE